MKAMKTCSVAGCDRKHYGKGLCNMHYLRITRYGSLEQTFTVDARLNGNVERIPFSGCHVWVGDVNHRGYARASVGGKTTSMHRAAYEQAYGPIPSGMYVLHRCDVRSCINPEHLFLGSHDDNMRDMVSKGRQRRGERNAQSKLTEEQVREIRRSTLGKRALALMYGVTPNAVSCIKKRETWGHVQ